MHKINVIGRIKFGGIVKVNSIPIGQNLPMVAVMCPMAEVCPSKYTVRPTVPWTRWTVLWNPSIHYFWSTLSIVPWTEWTVLWNPSIHSDLPYPIVHPILLYHGQDGQYCGIQVHSMAMVENLAVF